MKKIKKFLSLLSFFTIIPTKQNSLIDASEVFYLSPIIGIIEGLIISLASYLLFFPQIINASLLLISHIIITGALHLDGFADYSDVIGSRKTGIDALKILKDPRKGSFAIVFTSCLIILRLSLFFIFDKSYEIILLSYLAGLESSYLISFFGTAPNYDGSGSLFIKNSKNNKKFIINLIIYLALLFLILFLFKNYILIYSQISLLAIPIIIRDSKKRIGFTNGDVIGFTIEVVEIISLLLVVK
ncbi:MAG: adenosylcobinamide-GDP ribazoletransferase [Caldisphaera sp.]|jgi:adenosylcobinamide-GDP ribazoletransferase|nr:MAG: hypothetical protein C0201_00315 [Caldisphaera sp.]